MLVLVKFQLMAMNKVTSEDVSMFLTAALVGLQKHGQHESVQPVLLTLALRIYELAVSLTAACVTVVVYSLLWHCWFNDMKSVESVKVCSDCPGFCLEGHDSTCGTEMTVHNGSCSSRSACLQRYCAQIFAWNSYLLCSSCWDLHSAWKEFWRGRNC